MRSRAISITMTEAELSRLDALRRGKTRSGAIQDLINDASEGGEAHLALSVDEARIHLAEAQRCLAKALRMNPSGTHRTERSREDHNGYHRTVRK